MNIKTKLLEDYVNFSDSTTKQNTYFGKIFFYLLLLYLCFYFISYLNTQISNTFSSQKISQTGNLDGNLILRQYKLDQMARCMELKSINRRLRQDQIAK